MNALYSPRRLLYQLVAAFSALVVVGAMLLPPAPAAYAAPSTTIVISGFRTRGPSGGNDEFVELFNKSASPVNIAGWKINASNVSGTIGTRVTINAGTTLQPGQYFLATNSTLSVGYSGSVPGNQTYTTGFGDDGGVAILDAANVIVDQVGMSGTSAYKEGTTLAPTTSNLNQEQRRTNRCVDTDNNGADFTYNSSSSNPHNMASTLQPCGGDDAPSVSSTTPANGAVGVALNANVSVTFSEPVTLTDPALTLTCANSGSHAVTRSGGPTTFTFDPSPDFTAGELCTATVVAGQVTDQDGTPQQMTANHVFTFTTVAVQLPGPDRIHDLQGATHRSPKLGATVTNVPGIVTAKKSNGFWLQDPIPDTNDATSEAIFVFTSAAPTVSVSDEVLVSGTVVEFRPGGDNPTATNLSLTEIAGPGLNVLVQGSGKPLPDPVVIGTGPGQRQPPAQVINDETGNVEMGLSFDAATDGIDFYESLEGMRVQVNNAVVVGPTNNFGEIWVLANNGAGASVRTERDGIIVRPGDFNPERIQIDDDLSPPAPKVNVGDHITGPIVGVIDYNFGNFELLNTSPLTGIVADGVQRESTTLQGTANQVTVGTFNVENLDPGDGPAKFNALAQGIVSRLGSPDIVVLEEVQDNNGAMNDGTVDASATLNALIAAIQAAGGPTYQFRQINPVNNQDGGEGGGNIRVAFIFNPARVTFVDRPGGGSTTATTVSAGAPGVPQLSASPGRIDPNNAAFNTSRKPLVGEFTFNGRTIFVVGNHFNSKGGDQPLFGRFQPPALNSETQRQAQATIVRDFVRQILQIDPNARVVVAGDLNDFAFSAPLQTLKSTPLVALIESLDEDEEYSYVFEGNSQTLDHILASNALNAALTGYDVVRFNAEFAEQDSDHDPQVARFLIDATPPTVTCSINLSSLWPPNHRMVPGVLTVNVSDAGSGPDGWKLVSVTSNEPDAGTGPEDVPNDIQGWSVGTDDTTGDLRAERSESGTGRIYSIVVEGRDKQGNTASCTAAVEVPRDQGGKKP